MNVDVIVFSKDRAAQLDLLLRSLYKNFLNLGHIFVLYDFSNHEFNCGYEIIKQKFPDVKFVYQTKETFAATIRATLGYSITSQYVLPFCDDDVMILETNIDDIIKHFTDDMVGISLRHSLSINTSYHTGEIFPLPLHTILDDKYMKWCWKDAPLTYCWGYPYMAGGCVYESRFLDQILHKVNFVLPNSMESAMVNNRYMWNKWFCLCFKQNPLINVSINRVQHENQNRGGRDISYSPNELNNVLLAGKCINLQKVIDICTIKNNCEFIEITLEFE